MNAIRLGVLVALSLLSTTAPPQVAPAGSPIRATPRSDYVHVGPDSLFYEIAGEGPPIVLVHDGLVHREIWDEQFETFSDHFTVIRYDRRGYGASPAPTVAFSNVEDLRALFDHLGIERAGLVGMSSGGRLCIDFTLVYPESVASLVLVGAVVRGFPYTQHFYTRGGHLPPGLPRSEVHLWYATQDPYEMYAENREARARVLDLVKDRPVLEHTQLPGSASVPAPPEALERLGEISVPTLILVGEFDIPDVHAHAGAINAGIPGSSRDIIPRAGHLIPIEQPELFNQALEDFLGEVFGPDPGGD